MYQQYKTILKALGMLEHRVAGTIAVDNALEGGRPALMVNATQAVAHIIGVDPAAAVVTRRELWLQLATVALAGIVHETEQGRVEADED